MTLSKIAALVVAAGYVMVAFLVAEMRPAALASGAIATIAALACIWFSEALGDYAGPGPLSSTTRPTPALFIAIGGWIVLLAVPCLLLVASW